MITIKFKKIKLSILKIQSKLGPKKKPNNKIWMFPSSCHLEYRVGKLEISFLTTNSRKITFFVWYPHWIYSLHLVIHTYLTIFLLFFPFLEQHKMPFLKYFLIGEKAIKCFWVIKRQETGSPLLIYLQIS